MPINAEVAQALLEAFGRGDLPGILGMRPAPAIKAHSECVVHRESLG
jgi:hypothetical protein